MQKATGLSRRTRYVGWQEIKHFPESQDTTVKGSRHQGGGRKRLAVKDTHLLSDLDALVEPTRRGDPATPRRWTCKSLTHLADALKKQGHQISRQKVSELLQALGYRLPGTRKVKEGSSNPDRDAQCNYIHERVKAFQRRGQPVSSIDTKQKELSGEFQNKGREWRPQGCPEKVPIYDRLF